MRHFERRSNIYDKTYNYAFDFYETGKQADTAEVRSINRELILIGSPEVVRAFNHIFDTSADKLKQKQPGIKEEDIREIQTKTFKNLIQAIRKDLYPRQKHLKEEDIRLISPKQPSS